MKNNRGWGLSTMLVLCGIIGFALIVSAIVYDRSFNEDILPTPSNHDPILTESYKEMENKVTEAASKYVDKYYTNLHEGNKVYVSVKQLQVEKMLTDLVDTKQNICTGYVAFELIEGSIQYKPYIKCGNRYTTNGYNKSFDK